MESERGFRPRALGEIAIRCADLPAMTAFHEDALGLVRPSGDPRGGIVFDRLGESHGGHTAVLALFRHDAAVRPGLHPGGPRAPATGAASSLHHLAPALPASEQAAAVAWLEGRGLPCRVETFGWIGWRGVFTEDPEGNTVELVAFDPALLDSAGAD